MESYHLPPQELVGFNLAALRCKQRGPPESKHHHSSTLKSTNSVDSDENSVHSANSDDIFSDSAFKQMQPKGPTPPPYRRPQVPRRRATISGASPTDLPPLASQGNKESALTDKSDTDSGKGPSTTPPASTIPSPTVRGILSSTLTRIQESVSRARDQQLARSNSNTSAPGGSHSSDMGLHSLDYLFQSPTGRPKVNVPWITDATKQTPATNKTLFAVSRNSSSPPDRNTGNSPVTAVPAPLILSSFRASVAASPSTSPAAHLPRAKVVPLPPTEKPPPPPISDIISHEKETIPKSVICHEKHEVHKKEFQLKDPFRDPFRVSPTASELHYVDVCPEETEHKPVAPLPAKPTIYHQLLHGSTTPLSTRPAVGVVIPSHSSKSGDSSKSVPSVISYQLKPQSCEASDIPPPLPLRSVTLLPAPKVTPRGQFLYDCSILFH